MPALASTSPPLAVPATRLPLTTRLTFRSSPRSFFHSRGVMPWCSWYSAALALSPCVSFWSRARSLQRFWWLRFSSAETFVSLLVPGSVSLWLSSITGFASVPTQLPCLVLVFSRALPTRLMVRPSSPGICLLPSSSVWTVSPRPLSYFFGYFLPVALFGLLHVYSASLLLWHLPSRCFPLVASLLPRSRGFCRYGISLTPFRCLAPRPFYSRSPPFRSPGHARRLVCF